MADKFLNDNGLLYLWSKIKALVSGKVDKADGMGLSSNDFTDSEKTKLSGLSNYTHPTSGITAGTYRSVTVDTQGHITGGTNPTTLSGYGITDAVSTSAKGQANGVASLGSDGKVPTSQLPSYVDDIVEGYYYNGKFYETSAHTSELTAEGGKIYIDLETNLCYRYGGTTFVQITSADMVAITNEEIDTIVAS